MGKSSLDCFCSGVSCFTHLTTLFFWGNAFQQGQEQELFAAVHQVATRQGLRQTLQSV